MRKRKYWKKLRFDEVEGEREKREFSHCKQMLENYFLHVFHINYCLKRKTMKFHNKSFIGASVSTAFLYFLPPIPHLSNHHQMKLLWNFFLSISSLPFIIIIYTYLDIYFFFQVYMRTTRQLVKKLIQFTSTVSSSRLNNLTLHNHHFSSICCYGLISV
jgi:hypothetical protein